MKTTEAHPIELAIVAGLVVMESLMVLVVAAVALVVTLASWRPAPAPITTAEPAAPEARERKAEAGRSAAPGRPAQKVSAPVREVRAEPPAERKSAAPEAPLASPATHPLARVADQLTQLPVVALMLTLASDWIKDFAESPEDGLSAFPPGFDPPIYNVWKQQTKPTPHPLALLATELEALPAATLRSMAGTRSKRHTKAALVAMVAACS